MAIVVAFIGTSTFFDKYSDMKLNSIMNYAEDVWNTSIEDGSGDYQTQFHIYDSYSVEIDDDDLCLNGCSTLRERLNDADDWLYNNFSGYSTYDVVMVADHYTGSNNNNKWGVAQQTAGTSRNKCTLTNATPAENDNGRWADEGSEGLATHELLHMFIDESQTNITQLLIPITQHR